MGVLLELVGNGSPVKEGQVNVRAERTKVLQKEFGGTGALSYGTWAVIASLTL